MSWDIFVQDLPSAAQSIADIPGDFRPSHIGSRARVLEAIRSAAPLVEFRDDSWASLDAPGVSMHISISTEDPLKSFAFHIYGGDCSAGIVADILSRLNLRAIDPTADSGIFEPSQAAESLRRWKEYRAHVLKTRNA